MNDAAAFIVLATAVDSRSLDVLPERFCAGVELLRAPTLARAGRRDSEPRIAALTQPASIRPRVIGLVAVAVINDQKATRTA